MNINKDDLTIFLILAIVVLSAIFAAIFYNSDLNMNQANSKYNYKQYIINDRLNNKTYHAKKYISYPHGCIEFTTFENTSMYLCHNFSIIKVKY